VFRTKKQFKDILDVKKEISKIISKQHRATETYLNVSALEIEEILSELKEFNDKWNTLPIVCRIAKVKISEDSTKIITFHESLELPDIQHDFELIINMLNHMRQQKNLERTDLSLFVHPDEINFAYKEGKFPFQVTEILSQFVVVFQKGKIMRVGFVFGKNYVLLKN
jgi:hypothetical protein